MDDLLTPDERAWVELIRYAALADWSTTDLRDQFLAILDRLAPPPKGGDEPAAESVSVTSGAAESSAAAPGFTPEDLAWFTEARERIQSWTPIDCARAAVIILGLKVHAGFAEQREALWREYVALLDEQISSMAGLAGIHGWGSLPEWSVEGTRLRRLLGLDEKEATSDG